LQAAFAGLFPSTIGVTVLSGISLAFEPVLAALLAGVVAGMGITGGAGLFSVAAAERRSASRLFADRAGGRLYVAAARTEKIDG
jgi:hypothetical protein